MPVLGNPCFTEGTSYLKGSTDIHNRSISVIMYKYNVLDILYYIINGPAHNDVVLVLLFKVLESTINLRGTRSAGTSDKSRFRIFQ